GQLRVDGSLPRRTAHGTARTTMELSAQQLAFWDANGYLPYDDAPLLTEEEREAVGRRVEEVARGKFPDLPQAVYSVEGAVGRGGVGGRGGEVGRGKSPPPPEGVSSVEGAVPRGDINPADPYERYRIVRFLHKYNELILSIYRNPRILDVVENLLKPDIKLY